MNGLICLVLFSSASSFPITFASPSAFPFHPAVSFSPLGKSHGPGLRMRKAVGFLAWRRLQGQGPAGGGRGPGSSLQMLQTPLLDLLDSKVANQEGGGTKKKVHRPGTPGKTSPHSTVLHLTRPLNTERDRLVFQRGLRASLGAKAPDGNCTPTVTQPSSVCHVRIPCAGSSHLNQHGAG